MPPTEMKELGELIKFPVITHETPIQEHQRVVLIEAIDQYLYWRNHTPSEKTTSSHFLAIADQRKNNCKRF